MGTGRSSTQPFRMLNEFRRRLRKPVMEIGLSASLKQSPEYFRLFVVHDSGNI